MMQHSDQPDTSLDGFGLGSQPSASLFANVGSAPPDPILGLKQKFVADSNPNKVDLTAGVYKDDQGFTPKLEVVKDVEQQMSAAYTEAGYLPIDGLPSYIKAVQQLLFGSGAAALNEDRVVTVQSVGGTSALRYAGDFLARQFPGSALYVSDPTWANHRAIFERSGLRVDSYPYYDMNTHTVNFSDLKSTLASLPSRSIVLLHGCCHNPTGLDLSPDQWDELADLTKKAGLIPLIDFAYQGFAQGIDADAYAVRKFADEGLQFFAANSFSKNFSLYNRRIGALTYVAADPTEARNVLSQLKTDIRTNNSNPPLDGALIASSILSDPTLRTRWEQELQTMRDRIVDTRVKLVQALDQRGVGGHFQHVAKQNGMFSYSGLSTAQVQKLQDDFSVYAVKSGRICIAAITSSNLDYVADAVAAVVLKP